MPRSPRGFTLIELVIVIILLGILGVTAASRLIGRSSFDAIVARDQSIALARQIQLIGMNNPVTDSQASALMLAQDCFGAAPCNVSAPSSQVLNLSQQRVTLSRSPALPKTVYFDLLGRPFTFVSAAKEYLCISTRCQVTFHSVQHANKDVASLCINQEGYISAC